MREIFKKQFRLPKEGFSSPVDLVDVNIGFQVSKDKSQNGFRSVFKIYIKNKDFENKETLKPLIITASYGKEYKDGIITGSSDFKKKINWPIDLISSDDFFYNIKTNKFFDKNDKEINALNILKKIDKLHIKPSKPVRGIPLRAKLRYSNIISIIFSPIFNFFFSIVSGIHYSISGKKVTLLSNLSENRTMESTQISQGESINFYGFTLDLWIVFTYSILHLFALYIVYLFDYKPLWMIIIFNNNFLTLMYVIVSISIAKTFLPKIFSEPSQVLLNLLVKIQSWYFKCKFRKIKI